jgi:peptidoglycan hydrolase-like protein with peptidoglycan-binding domain
MVSSGYAAGPIDGLFGPITETALVRYQADHGLQIDGIAGPRTLRALTARGVILYPGAGYDPRGSPLVRGLQRLLAKAGYSPGPVDGRFGPRTERAVVRCQTAGRMQVSGIAGPRVFGYLIGSIHVHRSVSDRKVSRALTAQTRHMKRPTSSLSIGPLLIVGVLGVVLVLLAANGASSALRSDSGRRPPTRSDEAATAVDSLGDIGAPLKAPKAPVRASGAPAPSDTRDAGIDRLGDLDFVPVDTGAAGSGRWGRPDDGATPHRLREEVWLSRSGVVVTSGTLGGFLYAFVAASAARAMGPLDVLRAAAFLMIVLMLVYGGLVYLIARMGYMRRRSIFRHATRQELAAFVDKTDAAVCILVPSYKEDPGMIRQTLLSAALQEYRRRRVVLLIDDPSSPDAEQDRATLVAVRSVPGEIQALLDAAREPFTRALREVEGMAESGEIERKQETGRLASLYECAAAWFRTQAASMTAEDHSTALFVEMCLRELATRYAAAARNLQARLLSRGPYPKIEELLRRYRGLEALFAVEVTCFERKRYENLSHAPNKAANLNSYIGLMGRQLRATSTEHGLEVKDASTEQMDFEVPDADYVLTLDADSLLDPAYTARLVHFLEDPANARVAVAQTPYSAVPGASQTVERIAGATTDLQYVIHQGLTAHGATYWVGANAVLRKRALSDIATTISDPDTGRTYVRYIQDRTVIEDTESSVDLLARGWQLFNYPARMSYSATPPDFGSLVVQRQRWANGGLLVLPKLIRVLLRREAIDADALHGFMRLHYLISLAVVNAGVTILLLLPFAGWYTNAWLPLTALPYFALYTHDLRLAGYRHRDIIMVYALNLLLVPVNLAGVARSLHQAITGRVTPFKRTPKVSDRTPVPPTYIVAPFLLALFLIAASGVGFVRGSPWQGAAAAVNGLLLVYGVTVFVGWRSGCSDIAASCRCWNRPSSSRERSLGPCLEPSVHGGPPRAPRPRRSLAS